MKKLLFMALTALLAFTSCNDNDEPVSNVSDTSLLSIETEISSQTSSLRSSGSISLFPEGSELSLFVYKDNLGTDYPKGPYHNVRAEYKENKWNISSAVRLTDDNAFVYAFYPYSRFFGDGQGTIFIDHTSQTDYLYGTNADGSQIINKQNPNVRLQMKHLQALLQFNISKLNYSGEGKLTKIEVCNNNSKDIFSWGLFDLLSGKVTYVEGAHDSACIIDALGLAILEDITQNESDFLKLMVLPVEKTSADGSVIIRFVIDGKVYDYNVPVDTCWEEGTKYTYNVTLNGTTLQIDDVIIEEWVEGPEYPIELY